MISIVIELFLKECKQLVVGTNEFFPVCLCDLRKVADHPAGRFKMPFICQANKTIIGSDIRKEWELPAAQRPEVALAASRTQTGKQGHTFGQIRPDASNI